MGFEPGVHGRHLAGQPNKQDGSREKHKAHADLRNDQAPSDPRTHGGGGFASLQRRHQVEFPRRVHGRRR